MEPKIEEPTDDLVTDLCAAVARWAKREAIRLRDAETDVAVLTVRLQQPQSEVDGTLYLEYVIDETTSVERGGNVLPGVTFETQPR